MAIKSIYQSGFTYSPAQDQNNVVPAIVDVVQGESQMANPSTDVVWASGLGAAKFFMDFEEPTLTGSSTIAGRTEHTSRYPPLQESEDIWFAIDYLVPDGEAETDPESEIIYQYHVGSVGGSPNFSIQRKKGRFVVYLWIASGFENQMAFDVGPVTHDVWHKFIIKLFNHPTDGTLTVWKDGELARCYNPVTLNPWIVPTSPPGGGVTNDYTAYPSLGEVVETREGASVVVWEGKTTRGTYPNPTKYPKWGFYKSSWGSRYNPDKSIKPEAYDPEDPLYVAPAYRQKTIYIKNVKFETRVEDFSHLEIYKSLDTDGESPLEVPEWWVWTEYDISVTVNGSGSVTGDGTYNEEQEVTLTATPSAGWLFDYWEDADGTYNDNPLVFVATEDRDLTVYFVEEPPEPTQYTITVNIEGEGTVTGDGVYDEDEEVTLTATAETGWEFLHWSDTGGVYLDNPYVFNAESNRELDAVFIEETPPPTEYTVTVTQTTGGYVSGGGTYTEDDEATLTATPDSGWHFVRWSNDVTDNPYTFTVTEDVTLQAVFEQDEPVPGVITVKGKFRIV